MNSKHPVPVSARSSVLALSLGYALVLGACTGGGGSTSAPAPSLSSSAARIADRAPVVPPSAVAPFDGGVRRLHLPNPTLTPKAIAGRDLFFDRSLSASKSQSCATCHDPDHAYGPPNDRAVQLGGPRGTSPGLRAAPSIRYKEYTPGYADQLDNPDGISTPGPGGGFAWDGRADSLAEQAKAPLLSPFEMANASPAAVVAAVRASPSAASFVQAFGSGVFDDASAAFEDVTLALQAFQNEDTSFHPYSSKFDQNEEGHPEAAFTPAEERGRKVFDDPTKGNCAGCHFDGPGTLDGSTGMFTDYSYEAIGVPRNAAIPANRDAAYVDLGICGPVRTDRKQKKGDTSPFCALFKTPTLRNVATRHAFFHNGVFHSLEQAVRFYNTRDVTPELWYPTVAGKVQKFDDVPAQYRKNLDDQMPLDSRSPGSAPPMTEPELQDLLCFLETLTDDYRPGITPTSAKCLK